ncbi:MAG: 30S ribosomal protein S16 [Bacteroidia bacterium]|jgi:small subunit ribosomal protein S16
MAVKIRLQRHGKKGSAFFHLVVADGRAPRDGRFIEKIGTYNPNTNPATINLEFERALHWYGTGAQPTDTVRAIFSYKGVLAKYHLQGGVAKGAMTQEQADAKFEKMQADKTAKIEAKVTGLATAKATVKKTAAVNETKVREAVAAKVAAKLAPPAPVAEVVAEEEAAPAAEAEGETEA